MSDVAFKERCGLLYSLYVKPLMDMEDKRHRIVGKMLEEAGLWRQRNSVVLDETEEGMRAFDKYYAELTEHDPYTCLMAAWNARDASTPPVLTINGHSPFLTIHMEQP